MNRPDAPRNPARFRVGERPGAMDDGRATMLAVLTAYTGAWAAMGLNVVWVVIAVAALGRIAMERKRGDEPLKKGKLYERLWLEDMRATRKGQARSKSDAPAKSSGASSPASPTTTARTR